MIYFVQAQELWRIKIGYSARDSFRARLSALQTGSAVRLVVLALQPGSRHREQKLHRRFSKWRIDGEWFHPSAEILRFAFGRTSIEATASTLRTKNAIEEGDTVRLLSESLCGWKGLGQVSSIDTNGLTILKQKPPGDFAGDEVEACFDQVSLIRKGKTTNRH
jgi:Meiotically up-regulated gene 113